jgi:hypothetical protein
MLCVIGVYGFSVRVDVTQSVARYRSYGCRSGVSTRALIVRMCLSDPNATAEHEGLIGHRPFKSKVPLKLHNLLHA